MKEILPSEGAPSGPVVSEDTAKNYNKQANITSRKKKKKKYVKNIPCACACSVGGGNTLVVKGGLKKQLCTFETLFLIFPAHYFCGLPYKKKGVNINKRRIILLRN